jgi:pyrimidine-nucleoside phosphorylase
VGCVITGASAELAPADRKLYALRDVTATVESIPLITASIMSKKLAEGLDALVLDVKFGSGAFMKSLDDARKLAKSLVAVGRHMGVPTTGLLTDMHQPLGRMVGNAVEVNEAVESLGGGGPADLRELTLALGAELLVTSGQADSVDSAESILSDHLDSGRALEKFEAMVTAQGGNLAATRDVAPATELKAEGAGFVHQIDNGQLGQVVIELGGGRRVMSDKITHAAGLEMLVRPGDPVAVGQPLMRVFADGRTAAAVQVQLQAAVHLADEPPEVRPLIAERLQ